MEEDIQRATRTYTHEFNEAQDSSLWYELGKEVRIQYNGEEYLYVVGSGCLSSVCAGNAGGIYVTVPGRIVTWKEKTNTQGAALSVVAPVQDLEAKKALKELISKKEALQQINFW